MEKALKTKELLYKTDSPKHIILTKFFTDLFNLPDSQEYYVLFNKLVKLFGPEIVFNAIIDVYGMENINLKTNLYPLFVSVCKRYAFPSIDMSTNLIEEVTKLRKSKQKPKHIGGIFGE